jgi:hypothetical protein
MRAHVEQAFLKAYSPDLEGEFPFMYIDTKRLVTTATGVMIEPVELALKLEWMMGARRATAEEVVHDWNEINSREEELWNVFAPNQAKYTKVRLTSEGMEAVVKRRLDINIAYVREFLPNWDLWPSDAQLGTASLFWALGAGLDKTRPAFVRAANRSDWVTAKMHAHINDTGNKSLQERNRRQELCFDNAQVVMDRNLDPTLLFWPNRAPKEDDLHTTALKALELGIARDPGAKS